MVQFSTPPSNFLYFLEFLGKCGKIIGGRPPFGLAAPGNPGSANEWDGFLPSLQNCMLPSPLTYYLINTIPWTSMHSSRMRTARLLPVSPNMHCAGGCLLPGWGLCSRGVSATEVVSAPAGCLPLVRGVYPSMHWGRHLPSPRGQTDTCKNITFANYVCGQ